MGIWKQKGTKGPNKNGTTLAHSAFVPMEFLSNFSVTMVEPSYQSKCTNDTGQTLDCETFSVELGMSSDIRLGPAKTL